MIEACAAAADVPAAHAARDRSSPRSGVLGRASTDRLSGMTPAIRFRTAAAWPARVARSRWRRASGERDLLLVLLSGGGSALMALPAAGIPLEDKQRTARTLMEQGADIYELNTVRKHLSAIKGGQLALAARGTVLTLAVSDVVGDDLSVIASGTDRGGRQHVRRRARRPGSRVAGARLSAAGGRSARARRRRRRAGDASARRPAAGAHGARVIGPQRGAIEGATRGRRSARLSRACRPRAGHRGSARGGAAAHRTHASRAIASMPRPVCVIASGETTVTVSGSGEGRPQSGVRVRDGASRSHALGVARRRRQRRHRRHRRPDRCRRRHRRSQQHLSGPAAAGHRCARGLSDRQQHVRILRPARRSHSHRSHQHQRRRSAGHSRCVAIRIFFTASARRSITPPPRAS